MKGFFFIDSIPDVMFLYESSTFESCRLINNRLTKKEYEEAIKKYESEYLPKKVVKKVIKKSSKVKLKDKSFKIDLDDK